MSEYGPLAGLVASVGTVLAAGGAVTLAWVRNANWAPPEDDVPSGPAKVTSLLTAVAVAFLWFETGKRFSSGDLTQIAISFGIATVVSLIIYSLMMGIFVYDRQVARSADTVEVKKTIGGFWLRADAKTSLPKAKTVQRLFAGAAYDPDLVWPRFSRGLVKSVFILSFMSLILSGSIAISSIALSIDPSASTVPVNQPSGSKEGLQPPDLASPSRASGPPSPTSKPPALTTKTTP
jgi:hypothetical protein